MLPALRYIWCCCSVPPALISLSARRLSVLPRSFYLLLQTIFFVEIVNHFLCNCSNSAGFFNLVILRLKAPVIALPALLVPTSTISPSAYLTGLFAVDLACLNNWNHLVHNINVLSETLLLDTKLKKIRKSVYQVYTQELHQVERGRRRAWRSSGLGKRW